MRVVSLLASGTELCCALGAGEWLVGRSHECDHPEWVKSLPAVSEPTFDVSGTSAEIDRLVRARLRAGEPLYRVDEARMAALAPDVIITQTHCEVCAVTPGDLAHGPARLQRQPVVALTAGTLAGILDGFREVAGVLGLAGRGETLIAGIEARQEEITAKLARAPGAAGLRRPTVACLEWIDPVFVMGNWGPELVERAGGQPLLGEARGHSTVSPWDEVRRADPEVLVIAPCGFTIERTLGEMPTWQERPGWNELRAVREGRVFVADGNRYFNRSGPSVFETVEILAEIFHPDLFPPRMRGSAWRQYLAPEM
jgi:iron complex transport system substrate-binding protein